MDINDTISEGTTEFPDLDEHEIPESLRNNQIELLYVTDRAREIEHAAGVGAAAARSLSRVSWKPSAASAGVPGSTISGGAATATLRRPGWVISR